jgi:uridine kinase/ribulose-5-phosphate 4-epimerase/fuculose-1-phosphate aldolase
MSIKTSLIVGISGPSGVGKTTLSHLISLLYNKNEVIVISGDDLHKWERNHSNWEVYTHLNPEANNLDIGYEHLSQLKNNKSILRKKYNHSNGKFDEPIEIFNRPVIIHEGLHTLYDDKTLSLLDIKIYVDTDEDLTYEWKIKRDITSRGYTKNQIDEVISRRKNDNDTYIKPQIKNSNIVFKFKKNNKKIISLEYKIFKTDEEEYVKKIKEIYNIINDFLFICKKLSTEIDLIQGTGGNLSIKFKDRMIIKSSGYDISKVNFFNGYVICDLNQEISDFNNEKDYNDYISNSVINGDGFPSMEMGIHSKIKNKVVIHCHPVYLNVILCSKNSESIIKNIFSDFNYEFVKYVTPGYKLSNEIFDVNKSVFFLENHGLVVSGNNIKSVLKTIKKINNISKKWIENNFDYHIDSKKNNTTGFLFPDSVVFKDKLNIINEHILNTLYKCCLSPKFLTNNEIDEIEGLESEKLRKNIK